MIKVNKDLSQDENSPNGLLEQVQAKAQIFSSTALGGPHPLAVPPLYDRLNREEVLLRRPSIKEALNYLLHHLSQK